ncbi:MAG: hypothetical protein IRZ26_06760, partial [Clostridia bacterium]|nr:hypothetical protein [Clostridia bacterium]
MQLPLPQTVGWPGGPQFQTFGLFLLAAVLAGYALDRGERRDARWLAGLAGALLAGRLLRQAVFPDLAWNDPRSWLRLTGDAFSYEGALGGFLAGQAALAGGDWRGRLRALEGLALPLAAASALAMPAWPVEGIRSRLLALPDPAGQPALAVQLIGALAYAVLALSLAGRRRGAPGSMGVFLAASGLVRFALDWGVTGRTPWWGPLSAVQVEALAGFLAGVAWLLASGRPADLLERMRLPVEGLAALLLLAALVTVAASGAGRAGTAA